MSKVVLLLHALLLLPLVDAVRKKTSTKVKEEALEAALLNRQTSAQQAAVRQTSSFTLSSTSEGDGSQKAGHALLLGIEAISEGIMPFMQDPPDIERGFAIFDEKLWEVVKLIVEPELVASPDFQVAKANWDRAFEVTPGVVQDVKAFQSNGDSNALVSAIHSIVGVGLQSVASGYPSKAKYFNALNDFVDGLGEGWFLHSEGKTAQAVQSIWQGLKIAVDDVVPENVANDETYKLIMGTIDGVVSELSEHVLEYKRRILNSKVCYKRTAYRERSLPNQCRPGFEWDQGNLCWPSKDTGADCYETCGKVGGMCPSFCGSGKACCRRGFSDDPEECQGATGFKDYSFTKGSSSDYHQCVSPGPALQLQVRGCGELRANGLWVQAGSNSGRPRYRRVHDSDVIIEWSESRQVWRMFIDNTLGFGRATLYQSHENTPTFPTSDSWEVVDGSHPPPTLEPYLQDVDASLVQANSLDETVTAKGPSARKSDQGTHESMCDMNSDYNEKNGRWCVKRCPPSYRERSGQTCEQLCSGKFPADGGMGVCGTDPGELMTALAEMVQIVANGAIKTYMLIDQMSEAGVDAEKLSGTINTFIEMGKPFARPMCPEEVDSSSWVQRSK